MKSLLKIRPMARLIVIGVAAFCVGFFMVMLIGKTHRAVPAGVEDHQGSGVSQPDPKGPVVNGLLSEPVADEEDSISIGPTQSGIGHPETMMMPVDGSVVANYGWRRDPVMDDWRFTDGIEILCSPGSQVRAALSGRVAGVERDGRGALSIRLEHSGGIESLYENIRIAWVNVGDEVGQGASLGEVGVAPSSGGEGSMRFMIISHGELIDPAQCIGKRF